MNRWKNHSSTNFLPWFTFSTVMIWVFCSFQVSLYFFISFSVVQTYTTLKIHLTIIYQIYTLFFKYIYCKKKFFFYDYQISHYKTLFLQIHLGPMFLQIISCLCIIGALTTWAINFKQFMWCRYYVQYLPSMVDMLDHVDGLMQERRNSTAKSMG